VAALLIIQSWRRPLPAIFCVEKSFGFASASNTSRQQGSLLVGSKQLAATPATFSFDWIETYPSSMWLIPDSKPEIFLYKADTGTPHFHRGSASFNASPFEISPELHSSLTTYTGVCAVTKQKQQQQ
jgi:hypothetical protein